MAFFLSCLLVASAGHAATIYDNGANPTTGEVSDLAASRFIADNFVLTLGASTITGVHWTGGYQGPAPLPASDSFTLDFFVDTTGAPALDPFASYAIGGAGRTATGGTIGGASQYAYSAAIAPLPLAPGIPFWISIYNDTSSAGDTPWMWAVQGTEFEDQHAVFRTSGTDGWVTAFNRRFDFQLSGPVAAIPEPSTYALLLLGLGLVVFAARRRRPA